MKDFKIYFYELFKEDRVDMMSLNDIYGDLDDISEDEILYHAVDPEDGDIKLLIKTLTPEMLLKLKAGDGDSSVYDTYIDFAEQEQKDIVNHYIKNKEKLHEYPIIIKNTDAIDGFHRIIAAILSKQSLKALNISELSK